MPEGALDCLELLKDIEPPRAKSWHEVPASNCTRARVTNLDFSKGRSGKSVAL